MSVYMSDVSENKHALREHLSDSDYQKIIYDWNQTSQHYPRDKTIHQIFEEQVLQTPHQIALVYESTQLTYIELNHKANQIAHYLRTFFCIQADDLIALFFDRSDYMLIVMLGVLKSGASYLALDPNCADERLKYILKDAEINVLICNVIYEDRLKALISATDIPAFRIEQRILSIEKMQQSLANQSLENPQHTITSKNLAYVIYTSGTTGVPRGVMIEHASLVNFVCHQISLLQAEDIILSYFNYIFDAIYLELYPALLNGNTLHILNESTRSNVSELYDYVVKNEITYMGLPSILMTEFNNLPTPIKLRVLITGGDIYRGKIPDSVLMMNQYGVTEATVCTTVSYFKKVSSTHQYNVIGAPIFNTKVYVLDENHIPVSIGVVGELYIGGAGLARCYLNQAKITKERFIPNPFATEEDIEKKYTRLYKTGDLVRWLDSGELEYLGRADFQIKIRGFRVELGEISWQLLQHALVKECVVLYQKSELRAYVLLNKINNSEASSCYGISDQIDGRRLQSAIELELENFLEKRLPKYMLPSQYIQLDRLPYGATGKLDLQYLLSIKLPDMDYIAPKNEVERILCDIWSNIFKLDAVSVDAHFLKLGGNSLLLFPVITQIRQKCDVQLTLPELFEHLILRELAEYISLKKNEIQTANEKKSDFLKEQLFFDILATPSDTNLPFPLTDVQRAYLYGRHADWGLGGYSTQLYMTLEFTHLDVPLLERAWNQILEKHLALRLEFKDDRQCIRQEIPYYLINDIDHADAEQLMSNKIFDPCTYPLFELKVSKNKELYYFHVAIDLLICDAHSLNIIFSDLAICYRGGALAPLELSFRDCVCYLDKHKLHPSYQTAQRYWMDKIQDISGFPALPLLKSWTELPTVSMKSLVAKIKPEKLEAIKFKAAECDLSLTALFLILYGMVLARYSENQNVLLNVTLFDRKLLHPDIDKVVGDFTQLTLFEYVAQDQLDSIATIFTKHQKNLWEDLEHRQYSGVNVASEIKRCYGYSADYIVAPFVYTGLVGQSTISDYGINDFFTGNVYKHARTSQCILDNIVSEENEQLIINWFYVEDLISDDFISHIFDAYIGLIESLSDADWSLPFERLLLPKSDKLLIDAANPSNSLISEDTLVSLLDVHCMSQAPAVIDDTGVYRYVDIFCFSKSLAKRLIQHDKEVGPVVGVLCDNGYQRVVATLGIMQAGLAYLPLNLDWPLARVKEILVVGEVNHLILSAQQVSRYSELLSKYSYFVIEDCFSLPEEKTIDLPKVKPSDLAYVIFTSGSTGTPKGVSISHRSVVNTLLSVNERFEISKNDKVLALSDLSFDLSVYDIFGLLAVQGSVVFPSTTRIKEPSHWYELINKHNITVWNGVPQLMQLLLDSLETNRQALCGLKVVLLSGDWVSKEIPIKLREHDKCTRVISLGGATECSIWSVWYEIGIEDVHLSSIPYGQAMPNQQMYILNNHLEDCPIGVIGEIYIGGLGLALGYWRDDTNTDQSFITHPGLGRLYKTGDMGRWHPAGYIEFQGRKDSQIKRHGYRIELTEIENKLIQLLGVEQAVVRMQDDHMKAYLVIPSHSTKKVDPLLFKLEERGIRGDLTESYPLTPFLDENLYRQYKTYRRFATAELPEDSQLLPIRRAYKTNQPPSSIAQYDFDRIFSPLSAIRLDDKVLPKYLYPSAGSTYSVQCYLHLPCTLGSLQSGCYYFNPLSKTLQLMHSQVLGLVPSLEFKVYRPAIEPLYLRQTWFYYLELGHMLCLVMDVLDELTIGYELILPEKTTSSELSDTDYWTLATLVLSVNQQGNGVALCQLHTSVLHKYNDTFKSQYIDIHVDIKTFVSNSTGEISYVLNEAPSLVVFEGRGEIVSWIQAGYDAQRLIAHWHGLKLGSCALDLEHCRGVRCATIGEVVSDGVVYAFALGEILQEDELPGETQARGPELCNLIRNELIEILPSYMLPDSYCIKNQLPLTATGKIDYKALPAQSFSVNKSEYVPPKTELELKLCSIWKDVLGLEQIGISDDFFKCGGNSIHAIQLVARMQQIGVNVSVRELYLAKTIQELCNKGSCVSSVSSTPYLNFELIDGDTMAVFLK